MHVFIIPKKSGIHRFACLALYRALLRQCARLPPAVPSPETISQLVRERFRRYKTLQSPTQAANALKAGYEAFDLLHGVLHGNKPDIDHLSSVLATSNALKSKARFNQRMLADAQPKKVLSPNKQRRAKNRQLQDATALRHPNAQSILLRPRPVVSGRRRVPYFVNARGEPFLRIKKPQPQNLSRVIRSKLERRWKWIERRDRLIVEMLFAQDEDYWDSLVGDHESPTWKDDVQISLDDVITKLSDAENKAKELAEKLWNIVLAERKLAEEEEAERNRQLSEQGGTHEEGAMSSTSSTNMEHVSKSSDANFETIDHDHKFEIERQ